MGRINKEISNSDQLPEKFSQVVGDMVTVIRPQPVDEFFQRIYKVPAQIQNIWAKKQFYETYQQNEKLPSLMAELSWTHNRRIMSLKTAGIFKDSYVFKFLNLPIPYQEKELNEFYELLEGKGVE